MRLSLSSLSAVCALQVLGASAQALAEPVAACIQNCLAKVQATDIPACPAKDNACLCGNPSFNSGVQDCSWSTCQATAADISTFLTTGFCTGIPIVQSSSSAATPEKTEGAATTATEPPKAAETTAKPEEHTDADAGAKTTKTENPSSAPTTSVASGSKPKETSSNNPSKVADSSKETESSQAGGAAGGLSSGAEIGIGVGVAAGVLSIFGVALFLFLRSRKRNQDAESEAASNLPRGGRGFGSADSGSTLQKNQYDMEVISNRYEDMLPRQTPRVMV